MVSLLLLRPGGVSRSFATMLGERRLSDDKGSGTPLPNNAARRTDDGSVAHFVDGCSRPITT